MRKCVCEVQFILFFHDWVVIMMVRFDVAKWN